MVRAMVIARCYRLNKFFREGKKKMTIRQTVRALARKIKTVKAENPGVPVGDLVALVATAFGKAADPRFALMATFTLGGVETDVEVCDDSGKLRLFPTVESAIRSFAAAGEVADGVYAVKVDTGELYASKVPSDIYTAAESRSVKLNKIKVAQQAKHAAFDVLLNGAMYEWHLGNAAQQARYAEVLAQMGTVMSDINAINDELVELAALIASQNP